MRIFGITSVKYAAQFRGENPFVDKNPVPPDDRGRVEYASDYFLKQEKEHLSETFLKELCGEDEPILKGIGKKAKSAAENIKLKY